MQVNLLEAFKRLRKQPLLVVGDVMLDRYLSGNAERVSPEAPIIILQATEQEVRLGGAAGVAAFLRGLGADVTLAGVIGDDSAGTTLRNLCRDEGINTAWLLTDTSRPTTLKERFIGLAADRHGQQMLRVDHESRTPLNQSIETSLTEPVTNGIQGFAAVLISDYAKGVCNEELLCALISIAHKHRVPVLVDPGCGRSLELYRGATVLKPNRREGQLLSGIPLTSIDTAHAAACHLHKSLTNNRNSYYSIN